MATPPPLRIYYHRDFDGMVSAAVLANILKGWREQQVTWSSVNYDQRSDWDSFAQNEHFAVVDFHFHPRAQYWFDHHPTTFLSETLRARYQANDRWQWDENALSCPPLIIEHAARHWNHEVSERFKEMAVWSDIVDGARYDNVEQAVFGDEPALRVARALMASRGNAWLDELVGAMVDSTLEEIASRRDVDHCFQRASRNRDKALQQFPPTVESKELGVLHYDASSTEIRRERFAPFYHHPDIFFSVGVIPTRAGYHISAGRNPWNDPPVEIHIGEMMETYGGGGHRAVGGANPPDLAAARKAAHEVAGKLRRALAAVS